jgi:hypothetical protein
MKDVVMGVVENGRVEFLNAEDATAKKKWFNSYKQAEWIYFALQQLIKQSAAQKAAFCLQCRIR